MDGASLTFALRRAGTCRSVDRRRFSGGTGANLCKLEQRGFLQLGYGGGPCKNGLP